MSTTRKIRVAIVAPSLRHIGGQSVQADLLLNCWNGDPEVEAFFIPVDPGLGRYLELALEVPFLRTVLREFPYLMSLRRELKNADIVHAFSASYTSFLLAPAPALLIGHRLKKKVVINYRSGEAEDHLQRSARAVRLLAVADARIVPSLYLKTVFARFGLEANVVPNVIDTRQFRYRVREPLRPNFICSRGFHVYYRVDLVVRAFAAIKEAFPESRMCLVGKGSLEGQIRTLAHELNLRDVEFAGSVGRDKIGGFYDRADIFINASAVDNMPGSILEAFGAGTPVVSTAPEGVRYIVEHERTGLLCDPGDWKALAENALRLLREPGLARRIAANAYDESKRYHWENVRSGWLAVYRSLLRKNTTEVRDNCSSATPSVAS